MGAGCSFFKVPLIYVVLEETKEQPQFRGPNTWLSLGNSFYMFDLSVV